MLAVGCSHPTTERDTLYSCDAFEIYPDSITCHGKTHNAISKTEITGSWKSAGTGSTQISFTSGQKIADALFTKTIEETDSLDSDRIYLISALLNPEESMQTLRSLVSKGKIAQSDFPATVSNASWGAAAWEVYCATGSEQWLKESYQILTASLLNEYLMTSSHIYPLVHGKPIYADDTPDYYPSWMEDIDKFQTISTSVNAWRAYSYEIASRMASILNLKTEKEHLITALKIKSAINDNLWMPDKEFYGQYLYGQYYPLLSGITDNAANPLCILFGIATTEMAEAMLTKIPVLPDGIPSTYPIGDKTKQIPMNQALFALAAAKVRNTAIFNLAVASLWTMSLDTRQPALWPAIVCKAIFGMSLSPEGIDFTPMVPKHLTGDKYLTGLTYRKATLDICLKGTGDKVVSFMIDSANVIGNRIPHDIEGRHKIEITLSGNDLADRGANITSVTKMPDTPELRWDKATNAIITNFNPDCRYDIFINGTMTESVNSDRYSIGQSNPEVSDIIPVKNGFPGFAPRSHIHASDSTFQIIYASAITPRRTPLHLIKERATATNYIELAARHNTRITCYANVDSEGIYFLTVGYSNGSPRCAIRTLDINEQKSGILLCPAITAGDWISVHPSNTIAVRLKQGSNKISLTYIQGTMLLNKITLLKKR